MDKSVITKLFVASAILGIAIGFVSDLFIRAIHLVNRLLWSSDWLTRATDKPWLVVVIAVAGGLLMGLCVKYFGTNDEGIGFEAVMASVKKDGELGVKQLRRVVINAYVGLIAGASIGPESPLVTLGGYCGDFLANRLRTTKQQVMAFIAIALGGSMGVLVDSPVAGPILFAEQPPTEDANTNKLLVFTSMVAASVGFGLYYLLGAPLLKGQELVPAYGGFRFIDLVYGLVIGVIGTGIGYVFKHLILKIRSASRQYLRDPIARGGLTGLTVGILGALFPLTLFDGSAQLSHLVTHIAQYSVVTLLVLAVVRIISTAVALGGGYQGGNIFPTIFIAGAVGLAIHGAFSFIPAPVAMVACMSSAMYVFIPMPLFAIFLFTEISSFSLVPVMAMALVSTFLIQTVYKEIPQ